LNGKPVRTTLYWNNPNSGNSGSVKLLRRPVRQGQECRELEHKIVAGTRETAEHRYMEHRYILTICNQSDGSWKFYPKFP
jgi:surface antigen